MIPPMGCNPTEWNNVAAIGSNMMYPASPTTLDSNPRTITLSMIRHGLRTRLRMPLRIHASINPECCATPIPNIATITSPNGAKPVKFVTT